MTIDIICLLVGLALGAIGAFIFVHKDPSAAAAIVARVTSLEADVAKLKAKA